MLTKLRELHSEIREKLGELDQLVANDQPQVDRLMHVRHALTRASRARTKLLETEIYPRLLSANISSQAEGVRRLKEEGKADLMASSQHIGRWSLRTITEEWNQYRSASNAVRIAMRRRIKAEQDLLYPLLAQLPV